MICWKIVYKAHMWGKLSLIYRENSHIFNLHSYLDLLLFSVEKIGRQKISAALPTLEEGFLQIKKQVFTYLSLGGVNVILL